MDGAVGCRRNILRRSRRVMLCRYAIDVFPARASRANVMQRDVRVDTRAYAEIAGKARSPPVEEVSLKIICLPGEAPRGLLCCHARCARGADLVRFAAAGRAPPPDRHAQGNPQAGLL